jgi:SAM-dependent methyltransferase
MSSSEKPSQETDPVNSSTSIETPLAQSQSNIWEQVETRAVNRAMDKAAVLVQEVLSLLRGEHANREAAIRSDFEAATKSEQERILKLIGEEASKSNGVLADTLCEEMTAHRNGIETSVSEELSQAEERAVNRIKDHFSKREEEILTLLRGEQENREAALLSEMENFKETLSGRIQNLATEQISELNSAQADILREEMTAHRQGVEKSVAEELSQVEERGLNRTKEYFSKVEEGILLLLRGEQENREAALRADWEKALKNVAELGDQLVEKLRGDMSGFDKELDNSINQELPLVEERAFNRAVEAVYERELATLGLLRSEAVAMDASLKALFQNEIERKRVAQNIQILTTRGAPSRARWATLSCAEETRRLDNTLTMDVALQRLQKAHPRAFKFWKERLPANDDAYRDHPEHNCSLISNNVVAAFRDFAAPYLIGSVLDVGCGTVAIPGYLEGYPPHLISGIDPLDAHQSHPFQFVRGVAEVLPWPDATFDTVVIATSLDHVLSIEMAMNEAHRVLKEGGVLLLWLGIVEDSPAYDPEDPDFVPIDQYHLFHFDRSWAKEVLSKHFDIVEEFDFDSVSFFYTLSPRKMNRA